MSDRGRLHLSRRRSSGRIWIVVESIVVVVVVIVVAIGEAITLGVAKQPRPRVACLKRVEETTFGQTPALGCFELHGRNVVI